MKIGIDIYPEEGGENIFDAIIVDLNDPTALPKALAEMKSKLEGFTEALHQNVPSVEAQIEDEEYYASDGCFVEIDGTCEHGLPSMVMAAGLV